MNGVDSKMVATRKFLPLLSVVIVLIGIGAVHFTSKESAEDYSFKPENRESDLKREKERDTLASKWNWSAVRSAVDQAEIDEVQSTTGWTLHVPVLYQALSKVEIDNYGNIILNERARQALEESFVFGEVSLDENTLNIMDSLIRKALPEPTGEQLAEVVNDYYNYLQYEKEYRKQGEELEAREGFFALIERREESFGVDIARRLFALDNARGLLMLDTMALGENTRLSQAERHVAHREILKEHFLSQKTDYYLADAEWLARFYYYLEDRDRIFDATLSSEEKWTQLEALSTSHFTSEELERVEYLLHAAI